MKCDKCPAECIDSCGIYGGYLDDDKCTLTEPKIALLNAVIASDDLTDHSIALINAIVDGVYDCEHCRRQHQSETMPHEIYCSDRDSYVLPTSICSDYQRKTKGE